MGEFKDLPPTEWIKRCLGLANDARTEAACAQGAARETYLRIAQQWEQVAADAANQIAQPSDLEAATGDIERRLGLRKKPPAPSVHKRARRGSVSPLSRLVAESITTARLRSGS